MARAPRYDFHKDPMARWRESKGPGQVARYNVAFCKVCGDGYRPLTYGAHRKTQKHKSAMK